MRPAATLLAALALAGCANLPSPSRNAVRLVTDPPGATATLANGQSCRTPCSVSVHRREDAEITFALAGYESERVLVRSVPAAAPRSGVVLFDRVRVGLHDGPVVNDPTGVTAFEHDPNPVNLRLRPIGTQR